MFQLVLAQAAAVLDNPLQFVTVLFEAVKSGDWAMVAGVVLVLVVALLRLGGKKASDALEDHSLAGGILYFIFETKPGGWLMNFGTSIAAAIGMAALAGESPSWALLKPVLLVSASGTAIWELIKDVKEWWESRKAPTV